ncbi:MAG: imidazole glycerol phosphate synthase subunit HisH [Planctomycetota bacterium]|jgi:imidazole glycerol phosphate synthase glutamine amidotransferase subunit
MNEVVVAATGVANLASIGAAFARLHVAVRNAEDGDDVRRAAAVLLPGVGNFAPARAELDRRGLVAALRERLAAGRPTLGICLGMQLCCDGSDEADGVPGLGVVRGRLRRFDAALRVPQMGWNRVQAAPGSRLLADGHAYFANSFRLAEPPADWTVATSDHGGPFVAALERGDVLLCQFHPELSGAYGAALLRRWLDAAHVEVAC